MSARIWLEITVSGFLYLLGSFFVLLTVEEVKDITFMSNLKGFLALITGSVIVSSFVLGLVMHRLTFSLLAPLFGFFERRFLVTTDGGEEFSYRLRRKIVKVRLYGSDRLNRELDMQYGYYAMFASLIIVFPFLGVSLSIWLNESIYSVPWVLTATIFLFLEIATIFAFWKQGVIYTQLREAAIDAVIEREVQKPNKDA